MKTIRSPFGDIDTMKTWWSARVRKFASGEAALPLDEELVRRIRWLAMVLRVVVKRDPRFAEPSAHDGALRLVETIPECLLDNLPRSIFHGETGQDDEDASTDLLRPSTSAERHQKLGFGTLVSERGFRHVV